MYFSEENAARIDFARIKIEEWHKNEKITDCHAWRIDAPCGIGC